MEESIKQELTRFEMAAIRRTAQNIKTMVDKRDKLTERIEKLSNELTDVVEMIDMWEAPVKKMTGGYTSEQVLSGFMEEDLKRIDEENSKSEEVELDSEESEAEVDFENLVWVNENRPTDNQ